MRPQFFATTAFAMLGLTPVPPATAQTAQPEVEQFAPAFSDAELKSFAVAVVEVRRLTDAYLPKLHSAATVEEQRQIEEIASVRLKEAVENKGMTVARFKEILAYSQNDPELAQRIRSHLPQSELQPREQ